MAVNIDLSATTTQASSPKKDPRFPSSVRPGVPIYNHGDIITINGTFPTNAVASRTFLGAKDGIIEQAAINGTLANGSGWIFDDTVGNPISIVKDPTRGKVILGQNYVNGAFESTLRYDSGAPIPENTKVYFARWERAEVKRNGVAYTPDYQLKHMRVSEQNSITDDALNNVKWHSWINGGSGYTGIYTGSSHSSNTRAVTPVNGHGYHPDNGWCLVEYFIDTGTQGTESGQVYFRIHQSGGTKRVGAINGVMVYGTATRLRWFLDQMYMGNWAQVALGVDNGSQEPQVQDIFRDDHRVVVGDGTGNSGWRRIEISDTNTLTTCTNREIQDWTTWTTNSISFKLNTGGLPKGLQQVYVRTIDGLDGTGMDNTIDAQQIWIYVK